jgi:hypothetical protein
MPCILDEKMETEIEKMKTEIQKLEHIIKECLCNNESETEINVLEDELRELEIQLGKMIELHNYQLCCNHVFIEDLIDLTPDKSKTIEYCVHCLFQK